MSRQCEVMGGQCEKFFVHTCGEGEAAQLIALLEEIAAERRCCINQIA